MAALHVHRTISQDTGAHSAWNVPCNGFGLEEIGFDFSADPLEHTPTHAVDYSYKGHGDHFQEHFHPDTTCRHPHCKDTNWGGYGRLHFRGSDCPPYERDPEPNAMADFWEALRADARDNAERKRKNDVRRDDR